MASSPSAPRRRRLVGVSTKMYFSYSQTLSYVSSVLEHLSLAPASAAAAAANQSRDDLLSQVDIFIIPDHVTLAATAALLKDTPILPGAQDAHHEDRGAFTGEVSPAVLAEAGCRIVELGHAERRRLFGETDADAARKAAAAVRNGMVPLVCIGELTRPSDDSSSSSSSAADAAVAAAVEECRPQVEAVLAAVPDTADVVLAYEPVWAIGAASPADPSHVVGVTRGIRALECVRRRDGQGSTTRIVYGGSAGPGLFAKLVAGGDGVDGLFLGRFAHDPAQFVKTIREVAEA